MTLPRAIYHRTPTGRDALHRADCSLPEHYRRTLAAVDRDAEFDDIAARLREYSVRELAGWLEDFEAIGLVESVKAEWLEELAAAAAYAPTPPAAAR